MTDEQMLDEIREANLTYLMLAQTMIRRNKPEALFRLGLSEDSADMIAILSPAQVFRVASTSQLLCRFRVDDEVVWGLLTNRTEHRTISESANRLHASILMSSHCAEAM